MSSSKPFSTKSGDKSPLPLPNRNILRNLSKANLGIYKFLINCSEFKKLAYTFFIEYKSKAWPNFFQPKHHQHPLYLLFICLLNYFFLFCFLLDSYFVQIRTEDHQNLIVQYALER
jgi:hypothetical protein